MLIDRKNSRSLWERRYAAQFNLRDNIDILTQLLSVIKHQFLINDRVLKWEDNNYPRRESSLLWSRLSATSPALGPGKEGSRIHGSMI